MPFDNDFDINMILTITLHMKKTYTVKGLSQNTPTQYLARNFFPIIKHTPLLYKKFNQFPLVWHNRRHFLGLE